MNANDLARRINDNLLWSHIKTEEAQAVGDQPEEIWAQIEALWWKRDELFVSGLYPLLLEREADPEGLASHCWFMAAGTTRAEIVRVIALSDEARERGLDVSWLPRLDAPPAPPPLPPPPRFSLAFLKDAFWRWTTFRRGESS